MLQGAMWPMSIVIGPPSIDAPIWVLEKGESFFINSLRRFESAEIGADCFEEAPFGEPDRSFQNFSVTISRGLTTGGCKTKHPPTQESRNEISTKQWCCVTIRNHLRISVCSCRPHSWDRDSFFWFQRPKGSRHRNHCDLCDHDASWLPRAMFHCSKKHKVALAAVANSFDAERFNLAKRDSEDFSYAPDKQKRNSMCKLLQNAGFSEVSPTNFHHEEFGEFALRVVKDYQKVWPRYFVANSFWADDEEFVFEDDQFARLIDWAEKSSD